MGRRRDNHEYALYKGDDLLALGTVDEIADAMGTNRDAVMRYKYDVYKNNTPGRSGRRLVLAE